MNNKIKDISLMSLMLALTIILNYLENYLELPFYLPGVRLGLANIIIMFCLIKLGWSKALILTIVKSGFVFSTRGLIAFLLSFSGGIGAFVLMFIFYYKLQGSLAAISISGALAFNLCQLLIIMLIYGDINFWYYGFVLETSGLISGSLTAIILRAALPLIPEVKK